MVSIPFTDGPSMIQQVTLDGTPYRLKLYWNSRNAFWSVAFYDLEDTLLLGGVSLRMGIDILKGHPDRGLPPGELWVLDPAGSFTEAAYEDFINDRGVLLAYIEESDFVNGALQ